MTSRRDETPHQSRNPVLEGIAASRRREILGILLDGDTSVTERELATRLATTERGASATDGTTTDVQSVVTELTNVHLPPLEDAGLITRNQDEVTVDTATHPAFEDPRFRLLLDTEADGLDEVLLHLADERRRILLTVLRDTKRPLSRTTLARELLRRETGDPDPDPSVVNDVIGSLYYAHLPKLENANLIECDPETGRSTYTGHPALEEVFTIIYEPDKRLVEAYDEFFEGLEAAYRTFTRRTSGEADWPHFWRDATHG